MKDISYISTRGHQEKFTASQAIIQGIAKDGGLFVPQQLPSLDQSLEELFPLSYQDLAYEIMKCYMTDFTEEELKSCISKAYGDNFDISTMVAIKEASGAYFLELFHGATLAFKDMALSILPHLMTTSMAKQGIKDEVVILTATSGDTGKAALEGFADVEGTKIIVFYPKEGVSSIQEKQMVTQEGDNTFVVSIEGNFDDAQSGVKDIFNDRDFNKTLKEKGYVLSSANSINIGRLVPQIVYYFYGYFQLVKQGTLAMHEPMNVTVPTGNFGNILAAYYAKAMGLPIKTFVCASNDNKILTDFLDTGFYNRQREFILTSSPSMDILISSNLERLLYEVTDNNTQAVEEYMSCLRDKGSYDLGKDVLPEDMFGYCATESQVAEAIKEVHNASGYIIDPHTAVGYYCFKSFVGEHDDHTPMLVASTASPYKFGGAVLEALEVNKEQADDHILIKSLEELSGVPVPEGIKKALQGEIKHQYTCKPVEMKEQVKNLLV